MRKRPLQGQSRTGIVYPSADAVDLISMLERALDDASSGLQRAAEELGAEAVAVLFCAGTQIEVTYSWSRLAKCATEQQQSIDGAGRFDALKTTVGPVDARNPLAQILRGLIS